MIIIRGKIAVLSVSELIGKLFLSRYSLMILYTVAFIEIALVKNNLKQIRFFFNYHNKLH